MKSYLLIRIAVEVEEEEWFGIKLGRESSMLPEPSELSKLSESSEPSKLPKPSEPGGTPARGPLGWIGRYKERRRENARRKRETQERARLSAEREERISRAAVSIEKLAAEVREMAEDPRACFCVYEDSVRKNLTGASLKSASGTDFPGVTEEARGSFPEEEGAQGVQKSKLVSLWQKHFPWEEFQGYFEQFWVERLLSEAIHPHFVILGTAPCLASLLEKYARGMKSVRWLISERDSGREISEFVEDFYTEYGLAIGLEILENPASFRRARLNCDVPANILDFTRETHLALLEVAEGSVWLDMLSVEEKQRRIAMRGAGIIYISLKEHWRKAQKRCGCPILP